MGGTLWRWLWEVPCGDGGGRYPAEVVMGGTLWRWWWEVPCGGDDARYPVEVVMYKGLNTSMTLPNT